MTPISEIPNKNWTEHLFIAYLIQSFRLGHIQYLHPVNAEDFSALYPLQAFSRGHEVLLQFCQVKKIKNKMVMNISPEVHKKLKQRKAGTAFYVGHIFEKTSEVNNAQFSLKSAKDFLRNFILVDASTLPNETVKIRYGKSKITRMAVAPVAKYQVPLKTRMGEKTKKIENQHYYSGVHARNLFSQKIIGEDFRDIYESTEADQLNPFIADKPTLFDEMKIPVDSISVFRLK